MVGNVMVNYQHGGNFQIIYHLFGKLPRYYQTSIDGKITKYSGKFTRIFGKFTTIFFSNNKQKKTLEKRGGRGELVVIYHIR